MILAVALFTLLLTLFMPAVVDEGLNAHGNPGERCKGKRADKDVHKELGYSTYSCSVHVHTSLCQELIVIDGSEVFACVTLAAEGFAVLDLLDVAETAGNTLIAVGVEGIEVD